MGACCPLVGVVYMLLRLAMEGPAVSVGGADGFMRVCIWLFARADVYPGACIG